ERALQKVAAAEPSSAALFLRFTAVLIGDGSAIALPDELAELFAGDCGDSEGASRAALKLQALWDLETGRLAQLRAEPGKPSDTRSPITRAEAQQGNRSSSTWVTSTSTGHVPWTPGRRGSSRACFSARRSMTATASPWTCWPACIDSRQGCWTR